MTTPGPPARPNAPERGYPGAPARSPGQDYRPGRDYADDEPDDDYGPVTGQFPVYGPLDADFTLTLPVIPGRAWPEYRPAEPEHRQPGPGYRPSGYEDYRRDDYRAPGRDGYRPAGPEAYHRPGGRDDYDAPHDRYGAPARDGYGAPAGSGPAGLQEPFPSYGPPGRHDRPGSDPGRGQDLRRHPDYLPPDELPTADFYRPAGRGKHAADPDAADPAAPAWGQPDAAWAPPAEPEAWDHPAHPDTWAPPAEPGAWDQPAHPEAWDHPAEAEAWDRRARPQAWDMPAQPDNPTVRLRRDYPGTQPAGAAPAQTGAGLLRSSSTMAVGTLASRATGFIRSAILIYALGTHDLGNAYNISNTLPNVVYQFALGGIFTSVIVPLLVRAAKRNSDRGEAYDQRIFTLGVLALGAVTLIATAAAAPITAVYAGNIGSAATYHLTLILAYFFIPQIFFYGVSSLAGAVLNARGSFAAPMWTPVINNVVVIFVGLMFIAAAGLNRSPAQISGAEVTLLGLGTTLGIVLQTAAMVPSLRRVGFRWKPRYDFRRAEVSEIGRMSGWMFGYVLTTQIAFLVTTRVANSAGAHVSQQAAGAGFAAYSNAYTLFQLPYAIVGISVITAMLPRMSAHAAEGKYWNVTADFSTATRLASVIVVPAALILAVLGGPLSEAVFGYGSTSASSARYLGEVFAVFSLGLLPYMLFQLLLRVFYAMQDSRTPAGIGLVTMVINIAANLIALAILPARDVVVGLGAGFGVANLIGTIIAWRVVGRRIGGLDSYAIRSSLVRMHLAAIPGALFAIAVGLMFSAILPGGRFGALLTVVCGGSGALLMYVVFAKAAGVTELADLTRTVRARLQRS